jgi:hypothetical protein
MRSVWTLAGYEERMFQKDREKRRVEGKGVVLCTSMFAGLDCFGVWTLYLHRDCRHSDQ